MVFDVEHPIVLKGGQAVDDRGSLKFVNEFCFQDAGIKRFYQVQNHQAGFIRAWHGHLHEAKFVYVPQGSAIVCATRIGPFNDGWSPDDVHRFVLSGLTPSVVYIPKGYYNGFKTLTDDAILLFFSTSMLEESKGDDIRVSWDAFGTKMWEVEPR